MSSGYLGIRLRYIYNLYKLMAEGSVKGRRVGRQNQWIITKEGRKKL